MANAKITKRLQLSSSFQGDLIEPTFRSFGAPSPAKRVVIAAPSMQTDLVNKHLLKRLEDALLNGTVPDNMQFDGFKEYVHSPTEFRREYMGVPYPYTEEEREHKAQVSYPERSLNHGKHPRVNT